MGDSPPALREVQRLFAGDILAKARAREGSGTELAALLRLPSGARIAERLAIYADGYPSRIHDALLDAFPAILTILGEGSFAALARRYAAIVDLSSYNLNDTGAQFASYCRRDPIIDNLPFLADLADLEWSVLEAFNAHDLPPVDPAAFSAWDLAEWERVTLRLQPSTRIVASAWPIRDLRECRDVPRDQIDLEIVDRPQTVLVHRAGFDVDTRTIDSVEATVLTALRRGDTLGETIESVDPNEPAAAERVMQFFAELMQRGLFSDATLAQ